MDELTQKPWNRDADIPGSISDSLGTLGAEELRSCYWLARNWLRAEGCIVDAGAFLGASSVAFAAGASDAGRRSYRGWPLLHVFDPFTVTEDYVAQFLSEKLGRIEKGDSYLETFERQTAAYQDMIRAYPGDFLSYNWDRTPVELLFVDNSRSVALNSHLIEQFYPSLIPGRSIIVQRAYYHCWHPHIHVTMEYLREHLTLLDEHIEYQAAAWLLASSIPQDKLQRLIDYDFSERERLDLLDRLIERSSARQRPMVEAVKLWQLFVDKDYNGAHKQLLLMEQSYGLEGNDALWARQALEIEALMNSLMRSEAPLGLSDNARASPLVPSREARSDKRLNETEIDYLGAVTSIARKEVDGSWLPAAPRSTDRPLRAPDFLIIGTQKAGTTWLHENIAMHPNIWMTPVKELYYFTERFTPSETAWEPKHRASQAEAERAWHSSLSAVGTALEDRISALQVIEEGTVSDDWYKRIFSFAPANTVCGESTPDYALLPRAALSHIVAMQPTMKAILMLRDPIDRIWSNARMLQDGFPTLEVLTDNWPLLVGRSNYPMMIRRWRASLGQDNLLLLDYAKIATNPSALLSAVCDHLGVVFDERLFPLRRQVFFEGKNNRIPEKLREFLRRETRSIYAEMADLLPELVNSWTDRRFND